MERAVHGENDDGRLIPACPLDIHSELARLEQSRLEQARLELTEDDRIGVIIRLDCASDGNPDRDLIHVADGRGGILILPVIGVCPCLDALLNIVGHRVRELPTSVRTVYGYCRDNQYKRCPRFPDLCTRPAYLEYLRKHLEDHPDTLTTLTDLPL